MGMSVVGVMAAVVVGVMVAMAGVAAGQGVAEQYLGAHNSARRAVGAGIPDLQWSVQLQAYASNWASDRANKARCALSHSGGPYGENIFWSSGASTPAAAVTAWVNEKQFYNYASNSCAPGQVCGHYTQVLHSGTMHDFGPVLGSEIFMFFHG
jgi:pathogenesis-related protein 1